MPIVYLILAIVIIIAYILLISFLFSITFQFLVPIGCVIFIGAVLYNYVKVVYEELIVGKGWIDSPTGAEPAFKQYFFRKAFYDYWEVVKKSGVRNVAVLVWAKDRGLYLFPWNHLLWFTFPLALGYIAVVAAGTLAGVLAYLIFGLAHLAIVAATAALAITAAYTLRGVERLLMLSRRISIKCPNRDCHEHIPLPYYFCPNKSCGAKHVNLLPGDYGVVKRQCQCGAWLPTLFLFGRNELPGYCPSCDKPLNPSIGVTKNIHIPIIGGRSAGKSHFLVAAMMEIHQREADGKVSVAFADKKSEDDYANWKRYFESGATVDSTRLKSPDAFLINLNSGGDDCLLYVYDPAGELFQQTDEMRTQGYFDYVTGIIFLIDPFSLPQVRNKFERELGVAKDRIRPSVLAPQDAYSNLLQILQQQRGVGSRSSKPLSVVLTKTDAFNISDGIQQLAAHQPPSEKRDKQSAESYAVRTWLEKNGEGNLLRGIERDFKNVSYFYCSPLGRLPDSSAAPFVPKGVLEPLGWLLRSDIDFETGTPKPISHTKTLAAPAYVPTVTTPGETMNGKLIAGMWGLSLVMLLAGSIFAVVIANTRKNDYASTAGYAYESDNSSVSNTRRAVPSAPSNSTSNLKTYNSNSAYNSNSTSFRTDTTVRVSGAALKRSDSSVIEHLSADAPLKVIEVVKPWYKVETKTGKVGWIHGNDIYPLR